MPVITDRLDAVKDVPLRTGGHHDPGDMVPGAFCVMEKFAYVTGQKWTDSPANCSRVIGALLRRYNDCTDQAGRDELTAGDGHDTERGYLAANFAVRTALPAWLDLAGASDAAQTCRALPAIVDAASAQAGRDAARASRKGLPDYWAWRTELREKVTAAVLKALKEKPAVAATVAVAVATATVAVATDAATVATDADAADPWGAYYNAIYQAVYERLRAFYVERFASVTTPLKPAFMGLLSSMVSLGDEGAA